MASKVNKKIACGFIISRREKLVGEFREQLVSLASHQIKGPITVIGGNLELLGAEKFSKEQRGYINEINLSLKSLKKLVDDFLDLSKIDQGKFTLNLKKIALALIVQKALKESKFSAKDKNVDVRLTILTKNIQVIVDRFRIEQAIKNVIDNAIKYSKADKTVNSEVKSLQNKVLIVVKDAGIGIPHDEQDSVFNRFFRGSNAKKVSTGTGLDLFMAKLISEESDGKIWFESKESKGTTFYVSIPSSGSSGMKKRSDERKVK